MIASMANTYSSLYYHIVFSTKNRGRWLKPAIENRVWEILAEVARDHRIVPIRIGGTDDHVHTLVSIPSATSLSKAVQAMKGISSKRMHEEFDSFKAFAWQDGYGAFTVSKSRVLAVEDYIRNQREHHATFGFQEELRILLRRHGVEYDERYIWG